MSFKSILLNAFVALTATSVFFLTGELIARTFWDSGYHHPYDWRRRTAGYTSEKNRGTFRILVLGDSNAYGQGVRVEETFAKVLEDILNNKVERNGNKFEVINLGWPGLNTADEYIELIKNGLRYEPDMVLVSYCINDIGPPGNLRTDPRASHYIRRSLNKGAFRLPIPESIDSFLTLKSDFYLFLLNRYNSLLHKIGMRQGVDHDKSLLMSYSEGTRDWMFTQQALDKIYTLCKQQNIMPTLVILPYFYELERYQFGIIHEKVTSTAKTTGFHVLDLLPVFIGKKSTDFIASRADTHPNAKAHKIMAEDIYKFLIGEGLIAL